MDSRSSGGPLGPGATRDLVVTGASPLAPAGATAVVLNVTVTNTTAPSFLTVYPAGNTRPLASNLNWMPGITVPNLVEVPVGTGGAITFYNLAGSVDVIADLEGYFTTPSGTAGGEVALTPARITDTRSGSGYPNAGSKLGPGGTLDIQVTGAGGVPAGGVAGVILNATVTNTTAPSFLTVWPTGAPRNLVSNLNWMTGDTIPNRVFVPVGSGGKVSVYSPSGTVDVIIDVGGYFTSSTATGAAFTPQSPVRILDTRVTGGTLGPGGVFTLQVGGTNGVPANATAVILNVTTTNTTAPSFLTVYPSTAARPFASDLNWLTGVTRPNLTVATLGSTGAISFYSPTGSVDVVADLFGYFSGTLSSNNTVAVSASPPSIAANGSSTSTVTATVTAPGGGAVAGDTITFSTGSPSATGSCGSVSPTSMATNASGVATTTYTSSTTAGTCSVTATEQATSPGTGQSGSTTITQTAPTTNQTYSVAPAGSTTVPISTTSSPDAGNVTYNATSLTASSTVCISLFPKDGPNAPVNTAGTWTFTASGATPNTALGEGTTDSNSAFIRSINGAPTAGGNSSANTTRQVCGIGTGTSGSVTFILNSFAPDAADVAVYHDTNGDGHLNVDSSGKPTEPFGASDPTWQSPGAGSGSFAGEIVQAVDRSAKTFQACTSPGTGSTCNTFSYANASNSYNYPAPNGGAGTIPITQAQFESYLSAQAPPFCTPACGGAATPAGSFVPGDKLDLISYNPSGPSTFTFASDVPMAPTGLTATFNSATSNVDLSWTAPINPDVAQDSTNTAMYCVLRATVTSGTVGTFGAFGGSGNASCPTAGPPTGNAVKASLGAAPATSLTDTSANAATTYVYEVFAQANANGGGATGPASAQSNQVSIPATAAKAPTSKQSVLTQGSGTSQSPNTLDSGDTLQFVFDNVSASNPLTVSGTWSINLIDYYGAEVQLSNTNATATVSTGGTTLTIAVTGAPTLVNPATATSGSTTPTAYNTTNRGVVKSATGIGTAAPLAWNLPGSGCVPSSSSCPAGQFTRQTPATPAAALATGSSTDNTTTQHLPFPIDDCTGSSHFKVDTSTNKITLDPGMGTCAFELRNNDPVAFFNGKGEQIASGTYDNTNGNSFTPSPALTAGQTVYGVYNFQFSDFAGTTTASNRTMWPSMTAQRAAPTTVPMVKVPNGVGATGGSNTIAVHWNNTVNQIGPASDYTVWNAADTATLFTGTATSGSGTSTITVTLNGALAAGTSYRLHVAAGSVKNSSTLEANPTQDVGFSVPTSTPTITAVTGPCVNSPCTTSNTTPTWTGTAATNSGATITSCAPGVAANLDGAGFSCSGVTIVSGNGTNSVSWTYTPPSPLGNGGHNVDFQVTDSLGNSNDTGTFFFSETGASLNLVSAVTDPFGSHNVFGSSAIVLTFDGPVSCPESSAGAWTFHNSYDGPGAGLGGSPDAVHDFAEGFLVGLGPNQCSLDYVTNPISTNDFGTLDYAQPAAPSSRVKGNPGPDLSSFVGAPVTEATRPAFSSLSAAGSSISSTVTVTYGEAILCSSVDANGSDYAVTVNTVADAVVSAACSGTITNGQSTKVDIVLLTAPAATTTVQVKSKNGGDGNTVRDKFGNFQFINQTVSDTAT